MEDGHKKQRPPQWRIELCERAVRLGRRIDYFMYGKEMSHPFLALIDPENKVRSEIHGVPYDRTRGYKQSRLNKIFEYSTAITTPLALDGIVHYVASHTDWEPYYPTLRSRFCEAARGYPLASERQWIAQGEANSVLMKWREMKAVAEDIDRLNLPYNRHGAGPHRFNCQSAIATVLHGTGQGHLRLSGKLAAPGWKVITPSDERHSQSAFEPSAA